MYNIVFNFPGVRIPGNITGCIEFLDSHEFHNISGTQLAMHNILNSAGD